MKSVDLPTLGRPTSPHARLLDVLKCSEEWKTLLQKRREGGAAAITDRRMTLIAARRRRRSKAPFFWVVM